MIVFLGIIQKVEVIIHHVIKDPQDTVSDRTSRAFAPRRCLMWPERPGNTWPHWLMPVLWSNTTTPP